LSGQILQRNLFAAVDAVFGGIVASHTSKCNEPAAIRANLLIVT